MDFVKGDPEAGVVTVIRGSAESFDTIPQAAILNMMIEICCSWNW